VLKGYFYDVCGWGQLSLTTILFLNKGVVYSFGVEMLFVPNFKALFRL
jgi:hypothetical protein